MFLPINKDDMDKRGWKELDFLFISGDAYVDHPSFGCAIITRLLEDKGYKVGVIAQPDWKDIDSFKIMGKPKYAVLISSGVIDSMVNHYTVNKKRRNDDVYSPGGKSGFRPDRAVIVYSNKIREVFGNIPIVIGGIESSLRRFAHYDYWDDKVRHSILVDSQADLLVYGMGEEPIVDIANRLKDNENIFNINGTAYFSKKDNLDSEIRDYIDLVENKLEIPKELSKKYEYIDSFEIVKSDKLKYAKAFKIEYQEQDNVYGKTIIQKHGDRYVIQNPPQKPITEKDMDRVYSLFYERSYHPVYKKSGGILAINEVEFSVASHRGCFGGCTFCALNFHQGRRILKRSDKSILNEVTLLTKQPNFKGYIHDVGGPTANFRNIACKKQTEFGVCKDRQCLYPTLCKNLIISHADYLNLLRQIRKIKGIKKVFIRSGIRFDYLMADKDDSFFKELCEHHISGQLKVAPEHIVDYVLDKMGKCKNNVFKAFSQKYDIINKKLNKKQFLVPYLMSSHPGSDLNAAIKLAEYIKELGHMPEQVQDFYPTPGTVSTCMFYTGIDPRNMQKVYVPKEYKEKQMQRALLQFSKRENYDLIKAALIKAGREDLIGSGKKCLIKENTFKVKQNTKSVRYSKR